MARLADLDSVKYRYERANIEPGTYTFHRPSVCNVKFPVDDHPIHKATKNPRKDEHTNAFIKTGEKIFYPAIWHKSKYEKIKDEIYKSYEDTKNRHLEELKKREKEAEIRRNRLKAFQKSQPSIKSDTQHEIDALNRATDLKNEQFQGARIANQIIMASKCHAIRDAQIVEKSIIRSELENENKRLDRMMEEERMLAIKKEQMKQEQNKRNRLENIVYIKKQITDRENTRTSEGSRKLRESALMNRNETSVKVDEINNVNKRRSDANTLKEFLDKCREELRLQKQKQGDEERQMEDRIKLFLQKRRERDAKFKAETEALKKKKEQQFDMMSNARLAEKSLRGELEDLRILKVREDVERQHREREKAATIRKIEEIRKLQAEREKQIADRRKQMALEISRDEEILLQVIKKNKQDAEDHEKKMQAKKQEMIKYKEAILRQISDKEKQRNEEILYHTNESKRLFAQLDERDNAERLAIRKKLEDLKVQSVPEKYINEVKLELSKLKYI